MKYDRIVLSLILGGFSLALPCAGQPLVYETSLASAITRAKYEGKLVLLDAGRPLCSDCVGMKLNFDSISPPVRQWLKASCVIYDCNIDTSTDWQPYAGTSGFALPLVVFIDPNAPGTTYASTTGLVPASTFLTDVTIRAKKNLPLVVTDVPGNPLTNASDANFIVTGLARINAVLIGAISNSPITAIKWRLNGSGGFQTATGTTNWSQLVTLPPGTNLFESYVQYAAGNSWTNKVYLVYLGPGGSKLPQTITFNSLTNQTYGVAPITLTATASSGLPVTFNVTSGPTTVSSNVLTITGAGTVTVTADQAGSATYSAAPSVPQTFTVNKAVLTVTANNASRNAGAPNPSFTASYSGFVNGETPSVLSGSPSLTTTATTNSPAGSYPITAAQSTLSAANYSFSFVNGTLTVNSLVPGDTDGNGIVDQAELNAVLAHYYWTNFPPYITNTAGLGQTNVTFAIGNFTAGVFRVQFTTNLANPNWHDLGQVIPLYQFIDTNAPTSQQRYYRLAAP
jgi:MBG domain (YGX type)